MKPRQPCNDMTSNIHLNKQHFALGEYNMWIRSRLQSPLDYKPQEILQYRYMEGYQFQVFTRWKVVAYNMEDIVTSQSKARGPSMESTPKAIIFPPQITLCKYIT